MLTVDPEDLKRYRELTLMQEQITDELNAIRAKWRKEGDGRCGPVNVRTPRRLSPSLTQEWVEKNAPNLLPTIQETVISCSKAKAVLPPAIYETLLVPYGEPRVTVKAD